jgi:hypothetical protein
MTFSRLLLLSAGQIGTSSAQLMNTPSKRPSDEFSVQPLDERDQGLQSQMFNQAPVTASPFVSLVTF